MKNLLFTFTLIFATSISNLKAQFSIAPIAGINLANNIIMINQAINRNPVNTIYNFSGFTVKYNLNERLSILTAIEYSQKGFRNIRNSDNPNQLYVDIRYHYLDILPIVEYKPRAYIGIYGGFNYGFRLYEDYKQKDNSWTSYYEDTLRNIDFGGLIGLRFYYKKIFINFHYNRSLINIGRAPQLLDGPDITLNQKNSTFQLGTGYFFYL